MDETRKIPNHIAIILDGNRRWARNKNIPTLQGHTAGAKNLEKIANYAKKVVEDGVKESLTGKIDALPTFENFCESCPYYSLCGYSFNFGEKREKIEAVKEQTIISLLEN